MRRAVVSLAAVAILAASCGDGMPDALAGRLQDDVAAIRVHAEAGRPGLARSALRRLVELVAARIESGRLDEDRGLEILAAAEAVEERLSLLPPPIEESPAPPPSEEAGGDEGDGNGKGNDKDQGSDGDQGHGNDD